MKDSLNNDNLSQDEFLFADEETDNKVGTARFLPWKILIVDDEQDVHLVTKMVLAGLEFNGRGVEFIHAYSAFEAQERIIDHADVAVAIVDVVMEQDDSGLQLVKWLRSDYGNRHLRIILRTGQPGMAPEDNIIEHYEINDYKAKSELSSQKLKTSIIAALRSYRDIVTIERTREGLQMMLDASAHFYTKDSINQFTQGLMHQIIALLQLDENPRYLHQGGVFVFSQPDYQILSSYGIFSGREGSYLTQEEKMLIDKHTDMLECDDACTNQKGFENEVVFYLKDLPHPITIYIRSVRPLSSVDRNLAYLLIKKSAIALENLILQERYQRSQTCIIKSLAKLTEFRDNETGNHIERVEILTQRLAQTLYEKGYYIDVIDPEFIEMIGLASMLHDIGKVAIKDNILLKPGKLDPHEWIEMKRHPEFGAQVLQDTNQFIQEGSPLLKMAERIAISHHERWDGTGYPKGLKQDSIPLEARIMAVVDVYDALVSERPYKPAWPKQEALDFIEEQLESHFDPIVAKTFIEMLSSN